MSAYILPPVNAEAIESSGARFGIAEGMLISSSVPESPPAAYAPGTTYALNAESSTGTPGGVITVWRSLQASNIGHTPSSSPTWWKNIGTTYSDWAAATSWATGAQVVRAVAGVHAIYQRLAPGGVDSAQPESDVLKWSRVSATSRWAMFDMLSAAPTVAVSPLTFRIAPGRASGLALLAANEGNVHVEMQVVGSPVYVTDDNFDSTPIESWDDYFFALFATKSNVVKLDLPTYSNGVIEVTITSDTGAITLGKAVVGNGQLLGDMLKGARVRRKSYSLVERDEDFGEIIGIKRRKRIRLVSAQFKTDKSVLLQAQAALESAETAPSVFIGVTVDSGAYAELLTFLALCKDSDVDPAHTQAGILSAELEGI